MFECLKNVDWDLLHRQKLALLHILAKKRVDTPGAEALEGVVNLLDALQDDAEDAGIWKFPEGTEDVPATQASSKRYYVEDDEGHHHGPMDDYEEAATVAEAIHGRIIAQAVEPPSEDAEQNGGREVHDGHA